MLTPEQTLNLYPQLDHIQGEDRKMIGEVMTKYRSLTKSRYYKPTMHEKLILIHILNTVADYFKTTPDAIRGDSRKETLSDARAVFVVIAVQKTPVPLEYAAGFVNRKEGAQHLLKKVARIPEVAAHIPKVIKLL